MIRVGCEYLRHAIHADTDQLLSDAREKLAGVEFDTMVGRGLSGALVVPLLARAMGKTFLIVRKPEDKANHSGAVAEGTLGPRWLFVDDIISSGATFDATKAVIDVLVAQQGFATTLVGSYEYYNKQYYSAGARP